MSEKVKCPKCGTIKTINGTEIRVRCSNKDTCGGRFYVTNNLVPKPRDRNKEKGTPSGQFIIHHTPVISDPINILFDTLDKSITSVWGPRPNGKNKWDAKYNMWLAFKKWFEGGR